MLLLPLMMMMKGVNRGEKRDYTFTLRECRCWLLEIYLLVLGLLKIMIFVPYSPQRVSWVRLGQKDSSSIRKLTSDRYSGTWLVGLLDRGDTKQPSPLLTKLIYGGCIHFSWLKTSSWSMGIQPRTAVAVAYTMIGSESTSSTTVQFLVWLFSKVFNNRRGRTTIFIFVSWSVFSIWYVMLPIANNAKCVPDRADL